MATRGIPQLLQLYIHYCEHGGSSRAVRQSLENGMLIKWTTKYPHIDVHLLRHNGHHPYISAEYITAPAPLPYTPVQSSRKANSKSRYAQNKASHVVSNELRYRDGATQPHRKGLAYHQVAVPNAADSREILDVLDMLRNRSGRKITKITTPVLTDTPSIQGIWTPFLHLDSLPNTDNQEDLDIDYQSLFQITIHENK
jgi:large subunit ribosomal protein L43